MRVFILSAAPRIHIYTYTSRAYYTGQQTSLLSMVLKLGVAHNVFGYFLQFVDIVGDVLLAEYR